MIWSCLIIALILPGGSQAVVGDPFQRRFSPAELDVYPQNFDIVQAPDGLIYVANSEGVLEFDGARWRQIKMPEDEFVRALAVDDQGRVFVGSYNHFGYLERDSGGQSIFVDLVDEFVTPEQRAQLADVWNVVPTEKGVFFTTFHKLFLWQDGAINTWNSEPGFGDFAHAGGRYLVRDRGQGLMELIDGELQPIPGTEFFANNRINAMTTLPDGRVLIIPEDQLYTLDGDRLEPFQMEYSALPKPTNIYRVEVLADGSLAMGTTTGDVHVISADGSSGRRFHISDYIISGLMIGQDGALWAATDEDIVRLSIPSPWSYFGSQHGFAGFVTDHDMFRGEQLISTNTGVYRLQPGGQNGGPNFERLDWGDNEFWSMLNKPEGLMVAESYKILLATGQGIEPITETVYPRRLVASRFDDDVVYIAGETGFATLVKQDGTWQVAGNFTDLDIRAYYVMEEGRRDLWVGTYGNAVYRFQLSSDYSRIEVTESFNEANGLKLDVSRGVVVSQVVDRLVFANEEGLFEFNGEVFVPATHPALGAYLNQGFEPGVEFHTRDSGEVWATSGRQLFRGIERNGRWQWNEVFLGPFHNTSVDMVVFDGAMTWVGAAAALIRYDSAMPEVEAPPVSIMLRGMQVRHADQSTEQVAIAESVSPSLPSARQTLTFSYSVPSYGQSGGAEFRTLLEGYDTDWSSWERQSEAAYSDLAPGWYLFRVQGRLSTGATAGEASLAFQIAPPWYRTNWAYLLFVSVALLLFVILTAGVVRWRSRYLRALNRRLEREVAQRAEALRERSEELELANLRLRDLSELDGLTGVANRRRLDTFMQKMWQSCRDQHSPLTVLMIDADHFKAYNDEHGHLDGDEVLKCLAATMQARVRDSRHLLARFGGEEFALVLPGFEMDAAVSYAEMLRAAVVEAGEKNRGITVSIGIGQVMPHEEEDLDTLLSRADEALYKAKDRGRNCVAV